MSEVEKLFEEFKGRLVEVECECDDEKRAKCVMYPEYCDGTRKEVIDLVQLIDEGLNNRLLADKDTRIEELEKELEQAKKVQVVEHFEAYGQCRDSRRIASLETENEELNDKLNNLSKVAEVRLANWQKYEQENAELKERVKTLTIHDTNAVLNGLEMKVLKDSHRDRANKTQEQLTKAKEYIRTLISCLINWVQEGDKDYCYITDAEQFLKECENER